MFANYGKKGTLEKHEDIEILRFLELQKTVRLVLTDQNSHAVDEPGDIYRVEKALKKIKRS